MASNVFQFKRIVLYNKVYDAAVNYNPTSGQDSREEFAKTIANAVSETIEPLIEALNNHVHFTSVSNPDPQQITGHSKIQP